MRIRDSLSLAEQEGLRYEFHCEDLPGAHSNTARITLTGSAGKEVTVQGASVGGGNILVSEIKGTIWRPHTLAPRALKEPPLNALICTNSSAMAEFVQYRNDLFKNFMQNDGVPRKEPEAIRPQEIEKKCQKVAYI